MSLSRSVLAGALVLFSFSAVGDGTLTVNGKTFKLNHAYSGTKKNSFDKKKTDIVILFADRELPADVLKDDFGVMEAQMKAPFNGVLAEIDPDKQVISGQVLSSALKKMDQFSSTGTQKVDLTVFTPTHVAGKLYMPKEDDFFDNKYIYSIDFDLPVSAASAKSAKSATPAAPPGKALPADGGDPRKAYDAYRKILAAGDMKALRETVSSDRAKSMDDPDFKKMFPLIQSMEPKNVKYVNGSQDGDKATLNVTAKDGKESSTGTVTMVKQSGKWKVDNESWQSRSE
jgi:hypothetical protein